VLAYHKKKQKKPASTRRTLFKPHVKWKHLARKYFVFTHRGHPRPVPFFWNSRSVTSCGGLNSATQLCSSCRTGSSLRRTGRSGWESTSCPVRSGWPSLSAPSRSTAAGPSWRVPAGWIWTATPDPPRQTRWEAARTASGSTRIPTEYRTCCCSRRGTERSWCRVRSATGTGSRTGSCTPRGRSWWGASAASAGGGGGGSVGTHRSYRSTRPCPGAPARCGAEWGWSAG